ncbi:hypothetical protein HMPREF1051_0751 [Neisseria sicca VK64]|uniref:Uncharacterized protein n=1 Tax=Neisseria sicca VK64 TaxID=1095748 RepID=I2NQM9_NEISI|nr:hypothetical protein HMPREF1051_0751 [Neisseria sicca VK64]
MIFRRPLDSLPQLFNCFPYRMRQLKSKILMSSFPRRRESTFEFWKLFFKYLFLKISNGFPPARE